MRILITAIIHSDIFV